MAVISYLKFILIVLFLSKQIDSHIDTCDAHNEDCVVLDSNLISNKPKINRYLLYEVNPGEGFNLRRDVYMRIAVLVKKLNEGNENYKWHLVLPPWGPLYHWKNRAIGYQGGIEWSKFFDLESLRKFVPVMELSSFMKEHGPSIDILYYLQHYAEGWTDGRWEEKVDIRECIDPPMYRSMGENRFEGWLWGLDQLYVRDFHCLSIQGYSTTLKNFLSHSSATAIMIDRAEVILHDNYGDLEYWMVRRSMVFSNKLISIGNEFRKAHLNSTDESDRTFQQVSLDSPIKRKAVGGPYVAVHFRRKDFLRARPKEVPSIGNAAQQIAEKMKQHELKVAFIASDMPQTEFKELQKYIPGAKRFFPTKEMHLDILDGGVAIVDQWICAHARYFIGTFESTFSFRIHEEREILGFPVKTTFNRLCGDNQTECTQPSKWTVVFK